MIFTDHLYVSNLPDIHTAQLASRCDFAIPLGEYERNAPKLED